VRFHSKGRLFSNGRTQHPGQRVVVDNLKQMENVPK